MKYIFRPALSIFDGILIVVFNMLLENGLGFWWMMLLLTISILVSSGIETGVYHWKAVQQDLPEEPEEEDPEFMPYAVALTEGYLQQMAERGDNEAATMLKMLQKEYPYG